MNKSIRVKGGLYGLLIGDAVGVPYEFSRPEELPPRALLEMAPPADFPRAHSGIKPGTWSDDGAMSLCLLESLMAHEALNLQDLAQRFVRWEREGHLAVDGVVFDIGLQTQEALRNIERGVLPERAGPAGLAHNGNGSLMRVLPLALWHTGTSLELVQLAHAQSLVTHRHVRSQVCCALYVLVARALIEGASMDEAWLEAEVLLATLYSTMPLFAGELSYVLAGKANAPTGTGYVVDSLWSARLACRAGRYEDVVKSAIELGNDTDTTACIAGGLAGVHFGFEGIPLKWTDALRGRDLVRPLEQQLLRRFAPKVPGAPTPT